jgi:hypothetical protein
MRGFWKAAGDNRLPASWGAAHVWRSANHRTSQKCAEFPPRRMSPLCRVKQLAKAVYAGASSQSSDESSRMRHGQRQRSAHLHLLGNSI